MESDYPGILHQVVIAEGGFVNNPADKGGPTNFGITQHTYDHWRATKKLPTRSVKLISKQEVSEIYETFYWQPMRASQFCYAICLMLFDTAVQWGVHDALVSIVGPALNIADAFLRNDANAVFPALYTDEKDPAKVVNAIYYKRYAFRVQRVLKDPTQIQFLAGWMARDAKIRKLALASIPSTSDSENHASPPPAQP